MIRPLLVRASWYPARTYECLAALFPVSVSSQIPETVGSVVCNKSASVAKRSSVARRLPFASSYNRIAMV